MTKATPTSDLEANIPSFMEICAGWHKSLENFDKFNRMLNSDAKIAQTPKELIWTLNKAKLYRFVPVLPEAELKKTPLLMVFAIMNRPHVLDLRRDTAMPNTCCGTDTICICSIGACPGQKTRT